MAFDYSVNFTAVDKISKKIDAINSKMSRMKNKASQASSGIQEKLGNLTLTSTFKLKTQQALQKVKQLKQKISEAKEDIQNIGAKAGAGGLAVLYGLSRTVQAYQDVARAKGEIASLGINDEGIKSITDEAIKFSNTWAGTGTSDFIRASYDIKSGIASLSDIDVGKFTAIAGMTAQATKSTTEEMTKLFALGHGIYREQFGTDIEFGEKFSSAISGAVQAFRTDGSDLVSGLSTLGATATKMGVSLEEQLSVLGMSKSAFNSASEGATSYRAFLTGAIKANEEFGGELTDKVTGKLLPMADMLEKVKAKITGMGLSMQSAKASELMQKWFGSVEAVKMINATIDKTDELRTAQTKLREGMERGTELTLQMAKAMQEGKEFELMSQQVTNASMAIGAIFAPVALQIGGLIGRITLSIQEFTKENPKLAKVLGYTVAVLATMGVVAGFVAVAMWAVSLPILAIVGAVALVVVALVALYVYWEDITAFFISSWNRVYNYFAEVWNNIKIGFSEGLSFISEMWQQAMSFIFGENQFQTWGDAVKGVFDMLTAPIRLVISLIDSFMSKFEIYNQAKAKVTDIANSAGDAVESGWNNTKNFFGFGDEEQVAKTDSGINTMPKNQSVIEVKVTAEKGTTADTTAKSTGAVNLRNKRG